LGFIVSWEDRKRKRPKAHPSTLKVQTKKASLSTYTLHNTPGRLHRLKILRESLLTLPRDFLKNAEEDGKKGNNVSATKKAV